MAIWMLLCLVVSAEAEVNIGIGLPTVSIGINLPLYPELVPVPGYPVYYAPRVDANYFFYDGMYWVYQDDGWYASSWYNGPWGYVGPEVVPFYILRIPVRYYRQPPVYFRGWQSNAPPRWGHHWGNEWEERRSGWNRWKRGSAPAPAPLPVYQKKYSGEKYPLVEQQQKLRSQSYQYQPRNKVIQQHLNEQTGQKAPAATQRGRQTEPPVKGQRQQEPQRSMPLQQGAPPDPHSQPQRRGGENVQRGPEHAPSQQRNQPHQEQRKEPGAQHKEQRKEPGAQHQEQKAPRSQDNNRDDDKGRGRNN